VHGIDENLRLLPPRASRQELVRIEELHEHHSVVMDPTDDIDALQSVLVPDVDGGLVAVLPGCHDIRGFCDREAQDLSLGGYLMIGDILRVLGSVSAGLAVGSR
jgi:hypothetical protein